MIRRLLMIRRAPRLCVGFAAVFCLWSLAGCRPETPSEAPSEESESRRQTRQDVLGTLRSERDVQHHPSDGGGRAWLEGRAETTAASSGRFVLTYEAGELGIAEGGTVFLQVSPFWGWSTPQVESPAAPGFTTVSFLGEGDGPKIVPTTVDSQLLAVRLEGRGLEPGERLRFVYGAGAFEAQTDRFAESAESFFFAVDGDGDGYRKLLPEAPKIDLVAGEPSQIVALLPSTSRPGDVVRFHLSVLDSQGNAGTAFAGTLELATETALDSGLPQEVHFTPAQRGLRILELRPRNAGVLRIRVTGPDGLEASSNPLQVAEKGRRIYWGDLQNHSNYSDGTALPEELYAYARDIAALDVASVTDHDHWGLRFLDRHPELWRQIQTSTERFHEPGRFVTIRGFEWTNWVDGHRHVLVFDDAPLEILSSIDEAFDHPTELWRALRGRRAITIAHHSAGGPISTDWTIPPPPDLEPVTEIVSVHGSSEAADTPKPIYQPIAGNFVREAALGRGYKLGFIGSSDGHDGHPGLGHLASGTGGLAAILADELTRKGVEEALRARRTYATSGVRILLRAVYGGYVMGSEIPLENGVARRAAGDPVEVDVVPASQLLMQAIAPGPLERIDVVRSGDVTGIVDCRQELECTAAVRVDDLQAGEYLYIRAVQFDGHFAVSSPFFFVDPRPESR